MPRRLLPLLALPLLLSACVDVEHVLLRTSDGGIAWRLTASPVDASPPDLHPGLGEAIAPPGQDAVRAWSEARGSRTAYIVQARLDDLAAWQRWRSGLIARVQALLGTAPSWLLPPKLDASDANDLSLTVDVAPDPRLTGQGTWSLSIEGPFGVRGEGLRRLVSGRQGWQRDITELGAAGLHDQAIVLVDKPDPFAWVRQGGPSIAAALAGLALLVWANRRTRRRLRENAR